MTPEVNDAIWALRPDFVALSIVVHGGRNEVSGSHAAPPIRGMRRPLWADDHLAAWREAYTAFGAKPQRTPCSAEALWRRVARDGALAPINAVVDLYNEVSVRYSVPVGGEDLSSYVGRPRLVRASGGEPFETLRDGQPAVELVEPGEVVWRDEKGVTCRRWNWRQTPRTRLEVTTTDMWFVLERLHPMPLAGLMDAGEMLESGLRRLAPAAAVTTELIALPSLAP
jgi:DNA/RNA-binding domain of Phe-tRNA-synthetase-like protein